MNYAFDAAVGSSTQGGSEFSYLVSYYSPITQYHAMDALFESKQGSLSLPLFFLVFTRIMDGRLYSTFS